MRPFKPGKLTTVLDGGAGSSAKGLRAANMWRYNRADHTTFAVNTFMENAAHTISHKNGPEYVHQCLASITSLGGYEKQYISPGAVFAVETILREIEQHHITPKQLGIHPNAVIVQQKDVDYERGLVDFEGNPQKIKDCANLRIGSTLHGVGAARARRILRRPDVVLAKDVRELEPYICITQDEIMERLARGESGLLEIAQGFQLSLMSHFYPKCTSRNCSVAAALDDSLLPPAAVGPLVLNFRTFPIRVNNNKYRRLSDSKILTWAEYEQTEESDREVLKGDSGNCYVDQRELSWEDISKSAGTRIFEVTSLTKLPRRVFSFSKLNLLDALTSNNTGDDIFISINFMNYVDATVEQKTLPDAVLTPKVRSWLTENIVTPLRASRLAPQVKGMFIGTWRTVEDSVLVPWSVFGGAL
jgi:hypothetical protein